MNIKPIRNIVHPSSVFELPKDKRSFSNRIHIAQDLSNMMKKSLRDVPKNELTLDKYKEILYKIIYPAKPDIRFFDTPKFTKYKGRVETRAVDIENDGQRYNVHMGYDIFLPINSAGIIKDKDVMIHESRHLFDYLCNPKMAVTRLSELNQDKVKNEMAEKTIDYLVNTQFYNVPLFENFEMNIFQKRALKKLELFSNAEKIRILQRVRYNIFSELNAYGDIEERSYSPVATEVSMIDTLNLYKKREFIEKELKKALKLEREGVAKQA